MSYAIATFGCRVNQADSQALDARLRAEWGEPAGPAVADLVVVNTCAVTSGAERSARQMIRRVARENPRARVVVTGCYATRDTAGVGALAGVSAVWPNADKDRLLDEELVGAAPTGPGAEGRTAGFLRIQTGCSERCAYCAIPGTRGRPRSLPSVRVAAAVDGAARHGYHEVVLTGVHLGAYGRDLAPPSSLVDLLRVLDAGDGAPRLRLSSIEPMDFTGELIDLMARSRRIVPHVHLPLQHGSDNVLERMRRPYGAGTWLRLAEDIRRRMPGACIGTDVIAGFPGETESEFEATLDVVRRSPIGYLHAFPYSDRPGTEASSMPDKVPAATIRQRVARLRAIGGERCSAFVATQIGLVRDAVTLRDPTVALTDNYLKVRIPPGRSPNDRVNVRITSAEPLAGIVVGG